MIARTPAERAARAHALYQAIADILIAHGPDGHCDGAEYLAAFVTELLDHPEEAVADVAARLDAAWEAAES